MEVGDIISIDIRIKIHFAKALIVAGIENLA